MKRLAIIRHGERDGENISARQLDEIQQSGIAGVNQLIKGQKIVLHRGSEFGRTHQTILAFEKYLLKKPGSQQIGMLLADPRFGSKRIFDKFMTNSKIVAEAENSTWFEAFEHYQLEFITQTQKMMLKAVQQIFDSVQDGTTVILVGHTPLIEWLAFAIDTEEIIPRNLKLEELTGFSIEYNAGDIKIAKTIGFEIPVPQTV
jgi:broad specificity phosphatase PhoE